MRRLLLACVLLLSVPAVLHAQATATAEEQSAAAQKLISARKWVEAIALLERTCAEHPEFPMGWYQLAYAYRQASRFPEAVAAYERYLALRPGEPDAYYGMGLALASLGRSDEAVASFRKYVDLEKDPAKQKYVDRARAEIERLAPGTAPAPAPAPAPPAAPTAPTPAADIEAERRSAQRAFDARQYDEAADRYRSILAARPDDTSASYRLGVVLAVLGKLEEAIAAWAQTLLHDPTHAAARRNLELARARLESIGAGPPRTRDAALADASRLVEEGRYSAARFILDDHVAHGGTDDAAVRDVRARALLGAGDAAAAAAEYQVILALDPTWVRAHAGLGDAALAAGEPARARFFYLLYIERARGLPAEAAEVRRVETRLEGL